MNFHRAAPLSICVRINWEGSDDGIRIFQHVVSDVIMVCVYPVLVVKNWACRFTWRITLRYAVNEKCASQSEHFWGCKFLADIYLPGTMLLYFEEWRSLVWCLVVEGIKKQGILWIYIFFGFINSYVLEAIERCFEGLWQLFIHVNIFPYKRLECEFCR